MAFLKGQNTFLKDRGYELFSITSPGPALEDLVARDGVTAYPVTISRQITPIADTLALAKLYIALRKIRPTIVHASTPKAALLGMIASWAARVPNRIYFVRGLATEAEGGTRRAVFRRLERLTHKLSTETICVAPSLLAYAQKVGIIDRDKGSVVANGMSNGIDVTSFDPALFPDKPRDNLSIGFVGRLTQDKGIHELASAWFALREEFPSVRLLLVGPWEKESKVDSSVRARLESDPRVEITGFVKDVRPYFARMSVLAFPSHGTEGFPNAPMEAAAMQIPVVASAVVGCVDAVVDGVTGRLVPARDTARLTSALREYIQSEQLRREHGHAGRRRVIDSFQNEVIWRELKSTYDRMTSASP